MPRQRYFSMMIGLAHPALQWTLCLLFACYVAALSKGDVILHGTQRMLHAGQIAFASRFFALRCFAYDASAE